MWGCGDTGEVSMTGTGDRDTSTIVGLTGFTSGDVSLLTSGVGECQGRCLKCKESFVMDFPGRWVVPMCLLQVTTLSGSVSKGAQRRLAAKAFILSLWDETVAQSLSTSVNLSVVHCGNLVPMALPNIKVVRVSLVVEWGVELYARSAEWRTDLSSSLSSTACWMVFLRLLINHSTTPFTNGRRVVLFWCLMFRWLRKSFNSHLLNGGPN